MEISSQIALGQFGGKVCTIKNVLYGEYLYAASSVIAYDNKRRSIFTWRPGNIESDCYWTIQLVGQSYTIKNNYYNEYLYAAFNTIAYNAEFLHGYLEMLHMMLAGISSLFLLKVHLELETHLKMNICTRHPTQSLMMTEEDAFLRGDPAVLTQTLSGL